MIPNLTKVTQVQIVTGDLSGVRGDLSAVTGDLSAVTGDLTGVCGDLSGVTGDLGTCDITPADRCAGVDVASLIGSEMPKSKLRTGGHL